MIALSTGNMIGLGAMGAIFVVFALVVSMLVPRSRPGFPGRGGLPWLVAATVLLFAAMLGAVILFGAEEEEAGAHGPAAAVEEEEGGHSEVDKAPANTTAQAEPTAIEVSGTEFAFELPRREFQAGGYRFVLRNDGKVDHNLVVSGPEVDDVATDVIASGETDDVTVALLPGEYKLYCSVPGHEDAGMVTEIEVSTPS